MPSILIIDDEQGIRSVLRDVLVDEGYEVLLAEDGLRGLSLIETNPVDSSFSMSGSPIWAGSTS